MRLFYRLGLRMLSLGAGPIIARERGSTMNTTDTTKLHPLHALYVGRNHGEPGTLALRARLAREGAAEGDTPSVAGPSAGGAGAAIVAGLVAFVLVGKLVGKVAGGR